MTRRPAPDRARKPSVASVRVLRVVDARTISPTFRRIVVRSTDAGFDEEFSYFGYDHWFRLFFAAPGQRLELPVGGLDGWHQRLLAMPEDTRPAVRNYTIRDARRVDGAWELDVDFVLHRGESGEVEGEAARWALSCEPGEEIGFLDQGCIFGAYDDAPLLLVSDETGLPGVEGILRSLDHDRVDCIVEVPEVADRRGLALPDVTWVERASGALTGDAVLATLRRTVIDPAASAYVVGESTFVLEARRLCLAAGVPKARVDFCGYWRR